MNHPRITSVRTLNAYRLELEFSDGFHGEVDLRDVVVGKGGVFQALESPEFFRQVRVDEDAGTIAWPNNVDMCPDVLYERATRSSTHVRTGKA